LPSSTGTTVATHNSFTLNSGAGIITANINGVHQIGFVGPTISAAIGTRVFSSGANYTYDGVATQVSGTFVTSPTANTVNNLTINNSAGTSSTGVTLQQPIAVSNILTLSNGLLTTSSTNLLTINASGSVAGQVYATRTSGGSSNSFVNGIMRKIGNTNFVFPVGKLNAGHRLCAISAPVNATDVFDAEFMRASAKLLGPITAAGLSHVSNCEYWNIYRTTGTSNVNITLSWTGESNCNSAAYVNNLATLVIAHFSTSWDLYGATSTTGGPSSGTLTWDYAGPYNGTSNTPFTLGSTSPFDNPLPVKLTDVTAYKTQDGNKVEWTNRTEEGLYGYELERSANGRTFTTAFTQQAKMNNGSKADYKWLDAAPYSFITYYRIKAMDRTGSVTYSTVVKVQTDGDMQDGIVVYPNPVINNQVTVQLTGVKGLYKIRLINNFGQQVMQTQWQHNGGMATRSIELPKSVGTGIYHLQIVGDIQKLQTKIHIQ
jgi:hypothetical protein